MARGQIEKRGQRRRKLKPVILIVTEGSQTEPKYFEHYRSRQTNIDIRVLKAAAGYMGVSNGLLYDGFFSFAVVRQQALIPMVYKAVSRFKRCKAHPKLILPIAV